MPVLKIATRITQAGRPIDTGVDVFIDGQRIPNIRAAAGVFTVDYSIAESFPLVVINGVAKSVDQTGKACEKAAKWSAAAAAVLLIPQPELAVVAAAVAVAGVACGSAAPLLRDGLDVTRLITEEVVNTGTVIVRVRNPAGGQDRVSSKDYDTRNLSSLTMIFDVPFPASAPEVRLERPTFKPSRPTSADNYEVAGIVHNARIGSPISLRVEEFFADGPNEGEMFSEPVQVDENVQGDNHRISILVFKTGRPVRSVATLRAEGGRVASSSVDID